MTEIAENNVKNPSALAFVIALLLAPFAIGALGFWIGFIPVLAVAMGLFPYLVFGGPALWLYLKLLPHIPLLPSALLYGVNVAVFSGDTPLAGLVFDYSASDIKVRLEMGSLFAPIWGIAFEIIYAVCRRFDRA